jgi:hypothetical protein
MRAAGCLLVIFIMLIGCKQETGFDKYKKQAKLELASNKRVDSIFFGIYLGMVKKDFFMYCWEMNKKGIFTDGTDGRGNMFILYKPGIKLKYPASMNFYPDFHDSTIYKMRVLYQYEGWGPWNKHMTADSLLPDVLSTYKKWYSSGNEFIEMNDDKKGRLYAKVDGNRRIVITKADDVQVKVEFTDMLVENKMKNKDAAQ